jgi:predicted AAA+ superfamily ATPase
MVIMHIKRLIFNELVKQIKEPKISILIGPRQVGKTFLLKEVQAEADKKGYKTKFFDLEQPNDMLALGSNEKEQFDSLVSGGDIVFVDEMHLLKNISHIFKAIFDSRNRIKIFASGSSALTLHKHLKESMAGRVLFNRIYPLGLEELQQTSNYNYEDALVTGGMPALVSVSSLEEKISELQMIISTYINKDIKALIREENIRAFNHLIYLLADKQGSIVVTANLAREIGVSKPTVEKYLDILSQTYVCYILHSYSRNFSNELKKSKKYFLFDAGIRNCLLKDFSNISERTDAGYLKESFVYLNIIYQLKPNMDVHFWRTKQGYEVDFILLKNRRPFPVEVKSMLNAPDIPDGVKKFLNNYPEAQGAIVFNDSIIEDVEYAGRTIQFRIWTSATKIDYLQSIR